MRCLLIFAFAVVLLGQNPVVIHSTPGHRSAISLTVYHPYSGPSGSHEGFGLLREVRRVRVPQGRFILRWEGLPREVTEASAQLESLTPVPRLAALERNYDRNLISRTSLLAANLESPVVVDLRTGTPRPGVLMSLPEGAEGEVLVRTPEGLEAVGSDQIQFPGLPAGLTAEPSLSITLEAEAAGEVDLRLTLLVERIKWTAHYNLDMDPTFTSARLEGFALIENRSGMSFDGVQLALVAGPVTRTWKDLAQVLDALPAARRSTEVVVEVVATAVQEPLGEVHLFHWPHAFFLEGMQTKQVGLLGRPRVSVEPSILCGAFIGQGWEEGDYQNSETHLQLKVLNRRTDEGAGPWPEGSWVLRLPTPEGAPVLIQDSASSIPTGEAQSFASGALRVQIRSKLVAERRPWWGKFDREETWEVEVDWDQAIPRPGQAFLQVLLPLNAVTFGPDGFEQQGENIHQLPIDLNRNPPQSHRFKVRYQK